MLDGFPPHPPGYHVMGDALEFEKAFLEWRRMVMSSGYSERKQKLARQLAEARAAPQREDGDDAPDPLAASDSDSESGQSDDSEHAPFWPASGRMCVVYISWPVLPIRTRRTRGGNALTTGAAHTSNPAVGVGAAHAAPRVRRREWSHADIGNARDCVARATSAKRPSMSITVALSIGRSRINVPEPGTAWWAARHG